MSLKLKLRTKYHLNIPQISFDLEKLQDQSIVEIFKAKVGDKFAAVNLVDCNIDTLAGNIAVLLSTVQEVLVITRSKTLGHK